MVSGSSKVTPGSCSQHVLGRRAQLTQDLSAPLNQHLDRDPTSFALQLLLERAESNKSEIKEWIWWFYCANLHEDVLSREKIALIGGLSPGKTWPWGRNYHGRCSAPLFLWGFFGFWGFFWLLLLYFSNASQEFTNSAVIPFCGRLKSSGLSKTQWKPTHPLSNFVFPKPGPSCQGELQAVPTLQINFAPQQKTQRNSLCQPCISSPSSLQQITQKGSGAKEPPGLLAPSRFSSFPAHLPLFYLASPTLLVSLLQPNSRGKSCDYLLPASLQVLPRLFMCQSLPEQECCCRAGIV